MTCKRCFSMLSRYHDGVLSGDQREKVGAHLASCAACSERLAAYRQADTRISTAMRVTPNPRFRQAVLAATVRRSEQEVRVSPPLLARSRGQIVFGSVTGGSVAALVALLFGIGGFASRPTQMATVAPSPVQPLKVPMLAGMAQRRHVPTPTAVPRRHTLPARDDDRVLSGATNAARRSRLHMRRPDRAATFQIAREAPLLAGDAHWPLWSPDSNSLLYLAGWSVDPDSGWYAGTLLRYAPGGTIPLAKRVRNFAWAPDGSQLIYAVQTPSAAEPQALHIVRTDGSGDRVLAGIDHASVEYLSSGIFAVQRGRLVSIDPQSGRATSLADLAAIRVADEDSAFYALSANERFFAYQDSSGLRVWDRAGRALLVVREPLSRYRETSFHFSWEGDTLFYSTFDGRYTKLYRQSLAPFAEAVALNDNRPLHGPIDLVGPLSPDGSIVNFRIGVGASARNYVIDAQHGPAHVLLPPGGVGPVGWLSPDGRHMVYVVYRGASAVRSGIARVH